MYSCLSFHLHGLHGKGFTGWSLNSSYFLELVGWLAAWIQMTFTHYISRGNGHNAKIQEIQMKCQTQHWCILGIQWISTGNQERWAWYKPRAYSKWPLFPNLQTFPFYHKLVSHTHLLNFQPVLFCFVFSVLATCGSGVPGPGIRSKSRVWPTPQLWQHWILSSAAPGPGIKPATWRYREHRQWESWPNGSSSNFC